MRAVERDRPTIAVLGAAGLIGASIATALLREGFAVTPTARRFTSAQCNEFGAGAVAAPFVAFDAAALGRLLSRARADIVVNCVGVLQEIGRGGAQEVHAGFAARLLAAMAALERPALLIHVSIPGEARDDATAFSRTKREAERLIAASSNPYVILRPGFVVAPGAYGGGALILRARRDSVLAGRARWRTPLRRPRDWGSRGERRGDRTSVAGGRARLAGNLGRDGAAPVDGQCRHRRLSRPLRRAAGALRPSRPLARFWRGRRRPRRASRLVVADALDRARGIAARRHRKPRAWIDRLGIEPKTLEEAVAALPAVIQERWFARLYLLKALAIGGLALFWGWSGVIGLAFAGAARDLLTLRGVSPGTAEIAVIAGALLDCLVGGLIAARRTCRFGLLSALGVSVLYLAIATAVAPDLWFDPLGPLVKIVPAAILTLFALAILDDR